jgi:predicted Kef-type K+ transport protein
LVFALSAAHRSCRRGSARQIGEFSFILATVARDLGLLPDPAHNALVAASILSISLNPLLLPTD